MNYKVKLFIFKFLSFLPKGFGNFLYHYSQKLIQRNKIIYKINSSEASYKTAVNILAKNNISISNKNMLEIGSGWAPIIPYFFVYYSSIKKVFTFDINKHYDTYSIKKLNTYFNNKLTDDTSLVIDYKNKLPPFINYFPHTNLASSKCIINKEIDLIFSRNTLEHIPPNEIYKIHQNFSLQLSKTYYVLHMISPSDHRAYGDKSIAYHDFLKFSKSEWVSKQTKFDYHNRLRLPQYLKIFTDLNYEIIHLEYDKCMPDSKKFKEFKELKLHKDYKNFTDEENLAGSINILLRKLPQ